MTTTPSSKHTDLTHQYGCAATMTVVTFGLHGMLHRARRFWREDSPTTGKIEIYLLEPYAGAEYTTVTEDGWYDSAFCEEFLRYADPKNPCNSLDSTAISLISLVSLNRSSVGDLVSSDQYERFAAIELH